MKKHNAKTNIIDRAVAFFNPGNAVKRIVARQQLSMMSGGYVGGKKNKRSLQEWTTLNYDADADILPDLQTLRDRSRDLVRNSPIACGALKTKLTNVIGSGLKFHSRVDSDFLGLNNEQKIKIESTIEREFRFWSQSVNCDAEKSLDFFGLQRSAYMSAKESGDVIAILPMITRPGVLYKTAVQIIEADRLTNPNRQQDDDKITAGIERDQFGAPIKYFIQNRHPGNKIGYADVKWTAIDAFGKKSMRQNIIHLMQKNRPGQSRGVPDLAPVMELLKQLSRYSHAEIDAAVVAGKFTVFVKTDYTGSNALSPFEPTLESGGKASDKDFKMGNAAILDLLPGESIETTNPGRPNSNFDPFMIAILRQIGVALELPLEVLIKHFMASYSAARAAMIEAGRYYMTERSWFGNNFCQAIFAVWMHEAVSIGRISAPGFLFGDPLIRQAYLGSEWIGPARGQIDSLKENKADLIAEQRGWKTSAQNTAERGGDWDNNHRQRSVEVEKRRHDGLEPDIADDNDSAIEEITDEIA